MSEPDALDRYTRACNDCAAKVISSYSTSFGAAVRMLGRRHRVHVRNIYALVRIADELVDGVAAEAALGPEAQRRALDQLEQQLRAAIDHGYSSNPIVHAFSVTARECGIDRTLTEPFFESMRSDIDETGRGGMRTLGPLEHERYVYGSAKVVGLMCLRVFLRESRLSDGDREFAELGAEQLGAAFQNINFLRDLADDSERLHRDYLGAGELLDDEDRDEWIRIIDSQLDAARRSLPLLPKDARRAVRSALDLFAALSARLRRVPARELHVRRVRVPDPIKLAILAKAALVTLAERG